MPPSPRDEVSEAAGVAWRGKRNSRDRLLLPLNAILDRVAAETQLAEEESIEFGSDGTIILRHVYKHTFKMLQQCHRFG